MAFRLFDQIEFNYGVKWLSLRYQSWINNIRIFKVFILFFHQLKILEKFYFTNWKCWKKCKKILKHFGKILKFFGKILKFFIWQHQNFGFRTYLKWLLISKSRTKHWAYLGDIHNTRTCKVLNEDVITKNHILSCTQIPDCIFCFEAGMWECDLPFDTCSEFGLW